MFQQRPHCKFLGSIANGNPIMAFTFPKVLDTDDIENCFICLSYAEKDLVSYMPWYILFYDSDALVEMHWDGNVLYGLHLPFILVGFLT